MTAVGQVRREKSSPVGFLRSVVNELNLRLLRTTEADFRMKVFAQGALEYKMVSNDQILRTDIKLHAMFNYLMYM